MKPLVKWLLRQALDLFDYCGWVIGWSFVAWSVIVAVFVAYMPWIPRDVFIDATIDLMPTIILVVIGGHQLNRLLKHWAKSSTWWINEPA